MSRTDPDEDAAVAPSAGGPATDEATAAPAGAPAVTAAPTGSAPSSVRGPKLLLAVFAVFAVLSVGAVVIPGLMHRDGDKAPEIYGEVPPFAFIDHTGKRLASTDLEGQVVIVNFIFTRCDSICPMSSARMQRVQAKTADVGGSVKLLSISVDPDYDTPERLDAYATSFKADPSRWRFVTGDRSAVVETVTKGFLVAMEESGTSPSGAPNIIHSGHFILLDKQLRLRGFYDSDDLKRLDRLTRDARRLVREPFAGAAAAP